MRAPSRYNGTLRSAHTAAMAATLATGITDPPPRWWVFSIVTRSATDTSGTSAASAAATCSACSVPGGRPGTRRNAIPDRAAADAASIPPTWELASQTTNRPGRANACSAIWLHSVPVGR